MKNSSVKKGFTLIELLIVISIIGILAVALLPSVLGAPARARDAARKADLNNIIAALETYNADNNKYPATAASGKCIEDSVDAPGLVKLFSGAKVPNDPQSGNGPSTCTGSGKTGYAYCRLVGNPAAYVVYTKVEQSGANHTQAWVDSLCGAADSSALTTALGTSDTTPPLTVFAVVK